MNETYVFQDLLGEIEALREDLRATRRAVFTREEAAEYLRISVRTLHELREEGKVRAVQLSPGRHGYRRVELDRFLEENEGQASAAEIAEALVREAGVGA